MHRFYFPLSVALMASGSALAHTEPAHFHGALLSDAAFYSQEGEAGIPETPVEQMTRAQLQNEYQRLEGERPSIGGPIALTSVGGGLLLVGLGVGVEGILAFLYFGDSTAAYAAVGYMLLGLSAVMMITGAVLLTVGLVKLFTRIGARRAYTQRMDDINARLESYDRDDAPLAPPPPDELPPPPLPPGAWLFDVQPSHVVATF